MSTITKTEIDGCAVGMNHRHNFSANKVVTGKVSEYQLKAIAEVGGGKVSAGLREMVRFYIEQHPELRHHRRGLG